MRRLLLLALLLPASLVPAQEAPPNGPRRVDPMWHAIVGATIHVAPGKTIENGTVVLKGDRIATVGTAAAPEGARVWDGRGLHVYAGLVDAYVPVEVEVLEQRHWNPRITPWRTAREVDDATAKDLRALGFTAAAIAPAKGILRGKASVVSLAPREEDLSIPRPTVYAEGIFQAAGFDTVEEEGEGPPGRRKEGYPTSQMGAIALLRQSFLDGLAPGERLVFDTADEMEALRAAKIAREAGREAAVVGCGTEFRRLDAIAKDGLSLIIPLAFPEPPDVSSVGAADAADLRDLMTWEQAPTNPRRLDARGIMVALTTSKIGKRDRFFRRLAEAMRHGLAEDRALAMLTTSPAAILGLADRMGAIEPGKLANLAVTEGPLFVREPVVREVWIEGRRHEVTPALAPAAGTWTLEGDPLPASLALTVARKGRDGYEAKLSAGDKKADAQHLSLVGDRVAFSFDGEPLGKRGRFTLSAVARADALEGQGTDPDGARFRWKAARGPAPEPPLPPKQEPADVPETLGMPFGPYALDALPPQPERLIVRGATLWTSGPGGVIENGELEVRAGKIVYAGPARGDAGDATVLDATGRHVTPGIVDCHSHTGISKGVNEAGQAVTAEVRIGDVTDPDAISWYRELAGGVTTVNSLHGSANPIGGQNQVNKARWGVAHPDDMHFEGAPPGIKFALGENVKQSNWGDDFKTRYPQTRMGVETLMRDRLLAAREYAKGHDRRDLELEALAEVLAGTRLVHCHSYRQDEILMLCRLAEEFGFTIGTFQHVLEGYKVADAIRDRSLGGSSFSDWWAYKVEVQDAIPWNGALMHDVGVCVSFNSDSDEMARRLNLEASKAVKYGGLAPEEALKFVTLNPAKQLKIDDRVGSLEEGKDADFAIWSGPPLSVYSRCVATWIDGREYFSLERDKAHREKIAADRQRIIQEILGRPKEEEEEGHGEEKPPVRRSETWDCGECGCRGDR
ncbi:MAG TPA: amidohydrolase family protein [Planctomycetota bacterium]|nr:amidohydrolase family protein [Planctomycetota bacterium]